MNKPKHKRMLRDLPYLDRYAVKLYTEEGLNSKDIVLKMIKQGLLYYDKDTSSLKLYNLTCILVMSSGEKIKSRSLISKVDRLKKKVDDKDFDDLPDLKT